jgi:hypothetical protein
MKKFVAYFLYYDNGKYTKVRLATGDTEIDTKSRAVKALITSPRFNLSEQTLPSGEDNIISFFENNFSGDFDIEHYDGEH